MIARSCCLLACLVPLAAVDEDAPEKAIPLEQMARTQVAQAKYMLWDGDLYPAHPRWWVHPPDNASMEVAKEGARSGKRCLAFTGDGAAWLGFGFNLAGWWPPDAVHDISNYRNLSFWIRIEAAPGKFPNKPNVHLTGPATAEQPKGLESNTVDIENYAPGIMDGKWHEVVIPLKHLLSKKFDGSKVWEFSVGTWAQDRRSFTIWFDEIGVDNRED